MMSAAEAVRASRDPDQVQPITNQLAAIANAAEDRSQLLVSIAKVIHGNANHGVFLFRPDPELGWQKPSFSLLAGRPDLPSELFKWAQQVALRALNQAGLVSEFAAGEGANVAMSAMPIGDRHEVLVTLFDVFDQGLKETWVLPLAVGSIQQWDARAGAREPARRLVEVAAIVEAVTTFEKATDRDSCCQKMVDFVATQLSDQTDGCPVSVFVGTTTDGGSVSLRASTLESSANGIMADELVLAAMAECRCRQRLTCWPPAPDARYALLCHQRLAESLSLKQIVSVELSDADGRSQGVLLVGSKSKLPEHAPSFCSAVQTPLGAALEVVGRAEQNVVGRAFARIKKAWTKDRTRTVLKIAGLLVGLSLIPLPSAVHTDCELQPTERRFVSAPFDARLQSSSVEPGDFVEVGQTLATLDEQQVRLELAEVEAEYHRARKDQDGYLASHESGKAKLAALKAQGLEARQQLLRKRIDRLDLCSPIEGMVIAGDWEQALGKPLSQGESLFEIAPLNQFTVDVLIPADEVRFVQAGSTVRLRFEALPFETFTATIERINSAAEIRNSANVFVAKATLPNHRGQLRPGMQGNCRIAAAWQPVAWQYLRRPLARSMRWLGW